MDKTLKHRADIRRVPEEHAHSSIDATVETQLILDEERGHYLAAELRAIVDEEEALLRRALAAIDAAADLTRGGTQDLSGAAATAELRALRDEAASAAADDLPSLLHEMEVRQQLRRRGTGAQAVPDRRSPYLAHLRIREGGISKDYLLGHASLVDVGAGVRIVDWRAAPVARIFYTYREGDTYEEDFPGRVAEGVVEARRVLIIAGGTLRQIVGDGVALERGPDGRWVSGERAGLALQPGGAGTAARAGSLGVGAGLHGTRHAGPGDITALLDAEQYAAITAPPERPLLVLGSAGSGKTTVALHRMARIAAVDPERYPLSRMRVVVPEEGLARLSARLLEPLGAGGDSVRTLDAWAVELYRRVFGEPPPRLAEPPALVSRFKRHPELFAALRNRCARLRWEDTALPKLRRRLGVLFTDRPFLTQVVQASGGDLPMGVVEETVRHTLLQLAESPDKALRGIDKERRRAIDDQPLWAGTPDELARTLDVDDLPILLCLRAFGGALEKPPEALEMVHLVLDEAEDFALFELHVMGKLLGKTRSVTLAGDEAQQTAGGFAGWTSSLATMGVSSQGAVSCRLEVSYRCPRPVVELARRVLGSLAPESPARAAREGAPVGRFRFPDQAQAQLFLAGAVRDLIEREPRASVAVIASGAASARRFHELIADLPESRLVLQGEFSFAPGIDVTDVENAKGLEWDYVVLPDVSAEGYPLTDESRRRLHVAITRASHQLWVVSFGVASPLLD